MNKKTLNLVILLLLPLQAFALTATGYKKPDYSYYYTENPDGKIRCFRSLDKKNLGLESVLSFSEEFKKTRKAKLWASINNKTSKPRGPIINVDNDYKPRGPIINVDNDFRPTMGRLNLK